MESAVRNKSASALNELEILVPGEYLDSMCAQMTKDDEACQRLLLRCAPMHPMLETMVLSDGCALDFTNDPTIIHAHPTASDVDKA